MRKFVLSNLVIALLIGTLLTSLSPQKWITFYSLSAIYTFSIATLVAVLSRVFKPRLRSLSPLHRTLGNIGVFSAGGALGTLLGSGLATLAFPASNWDFWQYLLYLLGFNLFITITVGMVTTFYDRIRRQHDLARQALLEKERARRELEHRHTQAELKALQAQINPHFLFNTLNSIASLIPEDPRRAEAVVEKLADYFRKTLNLSRRLRVSLGEEIDLIENYLEIEKIRFGERLQYRIAVDEATRSCEIPALLIQPLVENCLKYAVTPNPDQTHLRLAVQQVTNKLLIEMQDDGPGLPEQWEQRGFGLSNLKARLRYAYGEEAQLEAFTRDGALIRLTVPRSASADMSSSPAKGYRYESI